MLHTLRHAADSWIAKIFLGILLLCFVLLWGVPQMQQNSSNTLISSGDSKLTLEDYNLAYNDTSYRYSLSIGRMLSPEELRQNNFSAYLINQLQQNVILDEEARLMKIGISEQGIADTIKEDTLFHDENGFNSNGFLENMQRFGANESDYVRYYAAQGKRNQLLLGAINGIKTPNVFYSAYQIFKEETRNADFVLLTADDVGTIADPDQATLETWFNTHQNDFQAPEYRKVSLMEMTPAMLVKAEDISTDEAKAFYDQNIARYSTPEKRSAEVLRFSSRTLADEAAKKLKDGMDFNALVLAENKTLADINSGELEIQQFPSSYANDIFSMKENEVSNVINDIQGPVIIRLLKITPKKPTDFADVEKDIKTLLANQQAASILRSNYETINNAQFEGVSLKELSTQYNLPLREITIDQNATTMDGQALNDLPQQQTLVGSIFQAYEGADLDPIAIQDGGYVWYRVDQIIPSRLKTLDEVKDTAIAAFKAEELQRLLDKKATELVQKLKDGSSFDEVASTLKKPKQRALALQRGKADTIFGQQGVDAVFNGAKGHNGFVTGTDTNSRIIFIVSEAVEPLNTSPEALSADDKIKIDFMTAEDLSSGFFEYARQRHPAVLNTNNYNLILNNY